MSILKAVKSANQSYVFLATNPEFLTYTIMIENTSNNLASNVVVTDIIPYGASFQAGTFTLNGVNIEKVDPNQGVNIGNINPNSSVVVTFDVMVHPSNPPMELQNYATITYTEDDRTEEIEIGDSAKALNYEVIDMQEAIDKKSSGKNIRLTSDVTHLLSEVRNQWGFKYPFE